MHADVLLKYGRVKLKNKKKTNVITRFKILLNSLFKILRFHKVIS